MEKTGGGDIQDLLRQHGEAGIYALADSAGIRVGQRLRCPFKGCADQTERKANVHVFAAGTTGIFKVMCYRCRTSGDLLDLLEAVRGYSKAEGIQYLRGNNSAPVKPALRVVPSTPAVDPDKLKPQQVRAVWDALATDDEHGRSYLEGRNLNDSPLVRFATEQSKDKAVRMHAKHGRRIGMLMTDVVGNPRGVQFRLARKAEAKENSQMSLKGSSLAFFGQPELIESAPLVLVAEGMADTLALHLWAAGAGVVVGAPGMSFLHRLAEALEGASIPVKGKTFGLFTQNDRPRNESRKEFVRLGQQLSQAGAHVVICNTDDEFEDLAEWRQVRPDVAWPPAELAKALGEDGDEQLDDTVKMVKADGASVPIAAAIRTNRYAQDFTTLCTLLDDPVHRDSIMGRGEFATSEMTGEPLYNGTTLGKSDMSAIRLGLEREGRSLDGKSLKFSAPDITEAIALIASRKKVHPIREWLLSLKWDGTPRIDDGLTKALGQASKTEGLACHLLRKWLISAVARPLHPGCKVDTVLVLAGAEELGKSAFFRAIGGKWFTDSKVNVDDDNGKRLMRRSWIIEWAELDAMRRARDQESIKAFLSQQTDVYRPLWSEALIEAPRHSVIVGTTNHLEFLTDANGNRRFWPVTVKELDVAWVQANREQLLAEAVVAFKAGEQWWLEEQYRPLLAKLNQGHEARDDWEALIVDWSPIRNGVLFEVTGARLLGPEVINKPAGQWSMTDRVRIGKIMKRLGWVAGTKRIDGEPQPIFRRPMAGEATK